ncbi:ABC transporter G family member 35-like protein, partial [Tanacetum coccineum]
MGVAALLGFVLLFNVLFTMGLAYIEALAQNGSLDSLKDYDVFIHLIVQFSWFRDGHISYEEFEAIMKSGNDWSKESIGSLKDIP